MSKSLEKVQQVQEDIVKKYNIKNLTISLTKMDSRSTTRGSTGAATATAVKKTSSSPPSKKTAARKSLSTEAALALASQGAANPKKPVAAARAKSKERARSTRRSTKVTAKGSPEKQRSQSRKSVNREIKKTEEKPVGVRARAGRPAKAKLQPGKLDKTSEFSLLTNLTQASTSTPVVNASPSRSISPASSSASHMSLRVNRTATPIIETITSANKSTSSHNSSSLLSHTPIRATSQQQQQQRYNAGYLQFTNKHVLSILLSTVLLVVFLAILNNAWVNAKLVKPFSDTLSKIAEKFSDKFFSYSSKSS